MEKKKKSIMYVHLVLPQKDINLYELSLIMCLELKMIDSYMIVLMNRIYGYK